jgi:hypothetical protein
MMSADAAKGGGTQGQSSGGGMGTQGQFPMSRLGKVKLPDPKYEERLAVKMSDFNRIRTSVRDLTDPRVHPSEWATTFFGAFVAFGVAFLTLPGAPHGHHNYHRVIFGVLALMTVILAGFMFWVEQGHRKDRKHAKTQIVADMDVVETEAPKIVTETGIPEEEEG